jgi:hypothetical protein
MAATLVASAGGGRLIYTNSAGDWSMTLVTSRISAYEPKNGESILVDLSGKDIALKFDSEANRDTAHTLIDTQFP